MKKIKIKINIRVLFPNFRNYPSTRKTKTKWNIWDWWKNCLRCWHPEIRIWSTRWSGCSSICPSTPTCAPGWSSAACCPNWSICCRIKEIRYVTKWIIFFYMTRFDLFKIFLFNVTESRLLRPLSFEHGWQSQKHVYLHWLHSYGHEVIYNDYHLNYHLKFHLQLILSFRKILSICDLILNAKNQNWI